MNPTGLSEIQKQALMDLLVVGMYADHKLASAEDARVEQLLDTFDFPSEYERQRFSDAAFSRAGRHAESPEAVRAYVKEIASHFSTRELQRNVYDTLNDLLTSDGKISTEESQLLSALGEAFDLR